MITELNFDQKEIEQRAKENSETYFDCREVEEPEESYYWI